MILYHYRSIRSALLEIENGTFHFSSRKELNDPIEGYVRIFWQGDKAAWEGLLRNYICSLSQAIDLFLLQGNEEILHHNSLVVDLHQFDDIPLGSILKSLGDLFLVDDDNKKLAAFYGNNGLKVCEEELRLILYFIHNKALILCIQNNRNFGRMSGEEANSLLKTFSSSKGLSFPFDLMKMELPDSEHRAKIARLAGNMIEDVCDFHYIHQGFNDESFLYGIRKDANGRDKIEDEIAEARHRRNWMAVAVDFPKVYVNQLKDMIFPESYVVCFSGNNNDSAMWGNYADRHHGVCLIYETDEDNKMILKGKRTFVRKVEPVKYKGKQIERNFFESFGGLNRIQIRTWLTGAENLSASYEAFSDEIAWRERYWEAFEAKTFRKTSDWRHENEYRLALEGTSSTFNTPESRNLKYDPKRLKGLIFGINTSEYDKMRLIDNLLIHADEYKDFCFYQAEYDDKAQKINIRKKILWQLKQPKDQ